MKVEKSFLKTLSLIIVAIILVGLLIALAGNIYHQDNSYEGIYTSVDSEAFSGLLSSHGYIGDTLKLYSDGSDMKFLQYKKEPEAKGGKFTIKGSIEKVGKYYVFTTEYYYLGDTVAWRAASKGIDPVRNMRLFFEPGKLTIFRHTAITDSLQDTVKIHYIRLK